MKNSEINEYATPTLDVQALEVEKGYVNSTFGVETEAIGDLEELC